MIYHCFSIKLHAWVQSDDLNFSYLYSESLLLNSAVFKFESYVLYQINSIISEHRPRVIVFNTSSSVNLVGRQCSSVATGLCSLFDQCLILPRLLLILQSDWLICHCR